jgi:molecular chaperone GrpE
MTDNHARNPSSAASEAEAAERAGASAPNQMAEAASPEEILPSAADSKRVDAVALARENAELKDRLLRTLAEMENLRRRTEREVSDARAYGVTALAHDSLAVADNLRRALAAIEAEGRATLPPAMAAFVEGVELTERELLKVLERHGIKRFDPLGEKFDPNVHQAMFEVPNPAAPAGTIVQVMQAGFMIGERVLRPALVGVAKGGPKIASEPAPANDNPAAEEAQGTI